MYNSVTVIANPCSGRASKRILRKAADFINSKGVRPHMLQTTRAGEATGLAKEASLAKTELIIAAGGDGTVNEVINGIAGTETPMAVLPIGTTNVLARELGIPFNMEGALDIALCLTPRPVSLGRVSAEGLSRHFCLMAGIGYDAATVLGVRTWLKNLTGKFAYIVSGISTLLAWDPEKLSVTVDGTVHTCHTLIASNSRKYAGDYDFAPGADIIEPVFHVFMINGRKRSDVLRFALGIIARRHMGIKGVTYLRGRDIAVEGSACIQTDGDYIGRTPASITAVPGALRLVY
jgi:YegS/Rv2252/BmrU family lipid kinase